MSTLPLAMKVLMTPMPVFSQNRRNCLLARRLAERGVRFIQIYSGGNHNDANWDAHGDLEKNHNYHAGNTDQPIAGLLKDLKQRGLLDDTIVVFAGEFGLRRLWSISLGSGYSGLTVVDARVVAAFSDGIGLIPATAAAEQWMHDHRVLSVPDFICNAGGVICASVEYHGGTQKQAFETIEEKIRANTREVLESARATNVMPSIAAAELAQRRVRESMGYRRGF